MEFAGDSSKPTGRRVRKLDEAAINRIAAGEVVERPASVVKELVENSIDAGATRILVGQSKGGKSLIRVVDDGCGISAEDLPLAVSRHATSKSDGSDLLNISTFGFRGEALPSMGAAGRLTVTSRDSGANGAFSIEVNGGEVSAVRPAALSAGTVVQLTDLFRTTPARLKFLRADTSEAKAIADAVRVLALAQPGIRFELQSVGQDGRSRSMLKFEASRKPGVEALLERLSIIVGNEFEDNAFSVEGERDGFRLSGICGLPTFSRGTLGQQYAFVNGRPVRDRLFFGAVKAAYSDFIPAGRFPVTALFIDCLPTEVDVNVHPSKAEVRFREAGIVRGLIVGALRAALAKEGHRSSTTISSHILGASRPSSSSPGRPWQSGYGSRSSQIGTSRVDAQSANHFGSIQPALGSMPPQSEEPIGETSRSQDYPLGAAKAQLHENYIVAQTAEGIVIVDQHAAHERLVYEELKSQYAAGRVESQLMLAPIVVDLGADERSIILEHADSLAAAGLSIEPFGPKGVAITAVPALLGGKLNGTSLVREIVESLSDSGRSQVLDDRINAILSRMSCHGSVRSGRHLTIEDMNALLRGMERTPGSGQCNHGRPTYVTLKLSAVERMFGRS